MKRFHDSPEVRAAYLIKTYGMFSLRTFYLKKSFKYCRTLDIL